jgi:hypothetical protein
MRKSTFPTLHSQKKRTIEVQRMTTHDYEQKLHDRFTRGEQLTDEELAHLEARYRAQDHAESDLLAKSYPPTDIVMLRAQLETALQQLTLVSQRITANEPDRTTV